MRVGDWVVVESRTYGSHWDGRVGQLVQLAGHQTPAYQVRGQEGWSFWVADVRLATPEEIAAAQLSSLPGGQL